MSQGWNNNNSSDANWTGQTSGKRSAQQASHSGYSNQNDEREVPSKMRKRDQKDNSIDLTSGGGDGCQVPTDGEFSSYPEIHPKTVEKLRENKIPNLFPIQQHSFYPIYNRKDLIGRELTGCGKTLAFVLPVIEQLRKAGTLGSRKIQAIVLAPTRELAIQCEKTVTMLKHHPNEYESLSVYGGVPIDVQTRKLTSGTDIFVGTTGRVWDHIERGNIDFSSMQTVILDEADQMLNMGFKEDIEKILKKIKAACSGRTIQICLFSATVPGWVREVANQHMRADLKVVDLAQNLANKTAKNVKHLAMEVPYHSRINALADVLNCYAVGKGKAIVFTQTKRDADELGKNPALKSIEAMHGDIPQSKREQTLARFRSDQLKVLVATDVASRGLDIPNVDIVVQVEPPNNAETYIHRSGRTARAGASGTCITFYNNRNEHLLDTIKEQSGIDLQKVDKPRPEDVRKANANNPSYQQQQQSSDNQTSRQQQQDYQPQQQQQSSSYRSQNNNNTQQSTNNSSCADVISLLESIRSDKLPQYEQQARRLIERHRGDSIAALCRALAYIAENNGQKSGTASTYASKGHDNYGGGSSGGGSWSGGNNGAGRGSSNRGGPQGGYGGSSYDNGQGRGGQGRGSQSRGGPSGGNSGGGGAWGSGGGAASSWDNCSNTVKEKSTVCEQTSFKHFKDKNDLTDSLVTSQKQQRYRDTSQSSALNYDSDKENQSAFDHEKLLLLGQQSLSKNADRTTPINQSKLRAPFSNYVLQPISDSKENNDPLQKKKLKLVLQPNEEESKQYCKEENQFSKNTVYVSNLSKSVDKGSLTNLFESVQLNVQKAKMLNNLQAKSCTQIKANEQTNLKCGYVQFKSFEEAQLAIQRCNDLQINGQTQKLIVSMISEQQQQQ